MGGYHVGRPSIAQVLAGHSPSTWPRWAATAGEAALVLVAASTGPTAPLALWAGKITQGGEGGGSGEGERRYAQLGRREGGWERERDSTSHHGHHGYPPCS